MKASNFVGDYVRSKDFSGDPELKGLFEGIEKVCLASNANQTLTAKHAKFVNTYFDKYPTSFDDTLGVAVTADKIYDFSTIRKMVAVCLAMIPLNTEFVTLQNPEESVSQPAAESKIKPEDISARLAKVKATNAKPA